MKFIRHDAPTRLEFDVFARSHWPLGRGIFHSRDGQVVVWVNQSDHVVVKSRDRGSVRSATQRLRMMMTCLEKHLKFSRHPRFGNLSVSPLNVGTGLETKVRMSLPNMVKNQKTLVGLCDRHGISLSRVDQTTFQFVNKKKLGITEFHIIIDFFTGVREIMEFEQSL